MAVSKATDTKADSAPATTRASRSDPSESDAPREEPTVVLGPRVSDCVVNDGRGRHVGRAVNGKVCSYHAMRYRADGSPR